MENNLTKVFFTAARSKIELAVYVAFLGIATLVFAGSVLQFDLMILQCFFGTASLCALALGGYCCYLLIASPWIVKCYEDHIEFCNTWMPWKQARIDCKDILGASSNWQGRGADSHCDIVLQLTTKIAAEIIRTGACRRVVNNIAYIDMSLSSVTPQEIVNQISRKKNSQNPTAEP